MSAAPIALEQEPIELDDVPFTPAQHFRLSVFGVIAQLVEACSAGDVEATLQAHPFLAEYLAEIDARTAPGDSFTSRWQRALGVWQDAAAAAGVRLPLAALIAAGMTPLELELLLAVGLTEEDARFGALFEAVQDHERKPTCGLMIAWFRSDGTGGDRGDEVRRALQTLLNLGLLTVPNAEAPRPDWTPAVSHVVWDAMRGELPDVRWLTRLPAALLRTQDRYLLPHDDQPSPMAVAAMLAGEPEQLVVVRGPAHNGRKTFVARVAHALGKSALVADESILSDDSRWLLFGVLATLANALAVVEHRLAPGEARVVPALPLLDGPLVVVTGRHGAWSWEQRPTLSIDLPIPTQSQRLEHWRASLVQDDAALATLAAQPRFTSGNIRRVAQTAAGLARVAGRGIVEPSDVRRACRTLPTARLETVATRLTTRGGLEDLVVDQATREELEGLVTRCRFREQLAVDSAAVAQMNAGVRALFSGGTGTGKTLAARLVAASLGKELFRIDLASTVSKYLGDTEKSLDAAFAAAEEIDAILLLDEGDALMATRTDVASSHDRYANLETNFLLQRIESFDSILLVTSNAPDRIDGAFARRMDVVINFRAPDEWRRYEILKLHLQPETVDDAWLREVACRCALSGGQLRNIAMDARLLALQAAESLQTEHVRAALARDYRKRGATCPVRSPDSSRRTRDRS